MVCFVGSSSGQLIDKPAIHCPVADFFLFCLFLCTLNIFQNPRNLRCGEIWGQVNARSLTDIFRLAHFFHAFADVLSPCTLPYNRMSERLSCHSIPRERGLSLVTDPDTYDLVFIDAGLFHQSLYNLDCILIYLG